MRNIFLFADSEDILCEMAAMVYLNI